MSEIFGDDLEQELAAPAPKSRKRTKVVESDNVRVVTPQRAPTVRIMLEQSDDIPPTGLPIGDNGKFYLLQPGVPADVPLGVKEILDQAVMSAPIVDPQTTQVVGYRDRLRYSYRVIGA